MLRSRLLIQGSTFLSFIFFLFLILYFSFCPSFYLFAYLYYYAIVVIEDTALDSVGEGSHFTCFMQFHAF